MTPLAPHIAEALRGLYEELAAEIARHAPLCVQSGRCCRFREYDHTLFLSALEAAYLLEQAPDASRPLDAGETCPWQDERGRCTARESRPLGCRIYFCDPHFQSVMPDLSEAFLSRLKLLSGEAGLSWDYAPLHVHLRRDRVRFPASGTEESAQFGSSCGGVGS